MFAETLARAGLEVVVLSGGRSREREVSLRSGAAVAQALQGAGYPCQLLVLDDNQLPVELESSRHLVLPMIHGCYGEDGNLSADLERAGFAYAGSNMAASVICFDKLACKGIAQAAGLRVASGCVIRPGFMPGYVELAALYGPRFVLKPRADGSSCHLHVVEDADQFEQACGQLTNEMYLLESYIGGSDVTVGVLEGEPLAVVLIEPEGDAVYDYAHKYTPGLTHYRAPAQLDPAVTAALRSGAALAFAVCGCRDFARVDFRLTPGGEPVFLEINTLPGMTATSLLPMSAAAVGIGFVELLERWVRLAAQRHPHGKELLHG